MSNVIRQLTNAKQRSVDARAQIALLAELFPKCFAVYEARRKPLKIGIRGDLVAAVGGFTGAQIRELHATLGRYVGSTGYLRAMDPKAVRVDLNGQPAGEVTLEESLIAKKRLYERATKRIRKAEFLKAKTEETKPKTEEQTSKQTESKQMKPSPSQKSSPRASERRGRRSLNHDERHYQYGQLEKL